VGLLTYEIRTQEGACPRHGRVTGIKQLPSLKFPIVITAVARGAAAMLPYRCPQCGGRIS
jgi:hypothetical protein